MIAPPKPFNETERLRELNKFNVLDSTPEPEFDEIVELASRICKAPISLISLVDDDRQWFKARIGVNVDETDRSISFCGHTILNNEIMVVPDTTSDRRFTDNPLVTGEPGIRFYAGAPIVSNGYQLGTICVLDLVPRSITEEEIRTLKILAGQVRKLLELRLSNRSLKLQLQVDQVQKEALQSFTKINSLLISVVRDKVGRTIDGLQKKLDSFDGRELGREAIFSLFNEVQQQLSGASALIQNLAEWNESQTRQPVREEAVELDTIVERIKDKLRRSHPGFSIALKTHLPGGILVSNYRSRLEFIIRHLFLQILAIAPDAQVHLSATADHDFVLMVLNVDDESVAGAFSSRLNVSEEDAYAEEKLPGLFFVEEMIIRLGGKLSVDRIEALGSMISFTFRNEG